MNVELEIICKRLLHPLQGGKFYVSQGSTIADLLDLAIRRYGSPDPRALEFLLYLQNDKAAQPDTELLKDAKIKVVRMLAGG